MGILVHRDSAQGNKLVGRIDYEVGAKATFQYDSAYLDNAQPRMAVVRRFLES